MTAWCQTCGGNREINVCPPSCNGSHVADYPRTCPDCAGTGLSSPAVVDLTEPPSSLVGPKGQVQSMSDWTPEAMAAEGARRREMRKRGLCPDSGLAVHSCHRGPCDCFEGDDCRRCFPRSSRAEKIRAAVVPEQLDQYLPDEPGPSCPPAFPSDGA